MIHRPVSAGDHTMGQTADNGKPKGTVNAYGKWIRRAVFLVLIPAIYLYTDRVINIEFLISNYQSYIIESVIFAIVFLALIFYYLIYFIITFIRSKYGLHARIVLAILLFVLPVLVFVGFFSECGRISEDHQNSRFRLDRVATGPPGNTTEQISFLMQ